MRYSDHMTSKNTERSTETKERRSLPVEVITPNQLIGYNMSYWRRKRHMTQEELGEHLERLTGRNWSKASVSAAERSWDGKRVRQFDADEIMALANVLEVPLTAFWLLPTDDGQTTQYAVSPRPSSTADKALSGQEFVDYLISEMQDDEDLEPVLRHFAERFQALLDSHFEEGTFDILIQHASGEVQVLELKRKEERYRNYARTLRNIVDELERESDGIAQHLGEAPEEQEMSDIQVIRDSLAQATENARNDTVLLINIQPILRVIASSSLGYSGLLLPELLQRLNDHRYHQEDIEHPLCARMRDKLTRYINEAASHREPAQRLLDEVYKELASGIELQLVKDIVGWLNNGGYKDEIIRQLGFTSTTQFTMLMAKYGVGPRPGPLVINHPSRASQ